MTLPLEAFTIAPVRARAPSDARNAASRAVSLTVGRRLSSVRCSNDGRGPLLGISAKKLAIAGRPTYRSGNGGIVRTASLRSRATNPAMSAASQDSIYRRTSDRRRVPRSDLLYAQVVKHRERGQVGQVSHKAVFGDPTHIAQRLQESVARTSINTSFVERENLCSLINKRLI